MPSKIYLVCCTVDEDRDRWKQFAPMSFHPTTIPNMRWLHPLFRSIHYYQVRRVSFCCSAEWEFHELFPMLSHVNALTLIAVSKVNGPSVFLLQRSPASIFGSIISMADIASSRPNSFLWWTNSPNCNSVNHFSHYQMFWCKKSMHMFLPFTASMNSPVISFHS